MKVLGVVVSRKGSKGIPRKSLAPLCGKPLIWHTIACAFAAKRLDRVIISTDCPETAAFAREHGVEVPFVRPAELAQDDTPTIPVLQHAIEQCPGFDAVLTLQPTNPMRLPSDIDGAIELMERTGCDSVISYSDVGEKHPFRMAFIEADGQVIPFSRDTFRRRQELTPVFLRNGAVYCSTVETINTGSIAGKDCRAWIIPPERAVNVDVTMDLMICEAMMKGNLNAD